MLRVSAIAVAACLLVSISDAQAALVSCHDYTPKSRIAGLGVANPRHLPIVAHKSLPFGTIVRFYNAHASVDSIVKDRGPFHGAREFDLDCKVMSRLDINGVGRVSTRVLGR